MTAMPQPAWNPPAPAQSWGAGRVVALVIGILVLLPALGLIAAGGVLLWADGPGRSDDGYLYSASDSFSSGGFALTSASINLSSGADWVPVSSALGSAKIQVTGANGSDVFLGIARVADATSYLGSVDRTVVTDLGSGSPAAIRTGSGAPVTPPGDQDFWVATTQGSGTQTLTWRPSAGNWTLVVMNADGSKGVSVDARVGATVPALSGLAWGLLGAGVFLLLVGVLVIVLAARRRPGAAAPYPAAGPAAAPYGTASYGTPQYGTPQYGAPPFWTPPAPVDRTTAADAGLETPSPAPPQQPPTP